MKIESADNKFLKLIKSLQKRKFRKEHNLFVTEGEKLTREALLKYEAEYVLVSEKYLGEFENAIIVKDSLFDSLCDTTTPQGVLGVFKIPQPIIDLDATGIVVALEDVQDPGNVGTIIRTADAFGVAGIILSEGCADLYSPKVLRSAMGSVFHLPIVRKQCFVDELARFKEKGFKLIAGDLKGQAVGGKEEKSVLIVGNEGNGLSIEVREICDELWKIEMAGEAESLNVSIATGILLYSMS